MTVLAIVLFAWMANSIRVYRDSEQQTRETAMKRALAETQHAAASVDAALQRVVPVVHSVAEQLSTGSVDQADAESLFVEATAQLPELVGIGALYRPAAARDQQPPHSPYYALADEDEINATAGQ